MNWVTIYIGGRVGFQEVVMPKLEKAWLPGSPEITEHLIMFWLPDISKLRHLKMSIGSKLIFKYRLHFFTDLDIYFKLEDKSSTEFSAHENNMVIKMTEWETAHRDMLIQQKNKGTALV